MQPGDPDFIDISTVGEDEKLAWQELKSRQEKESQSLTAESIDGSTLQSTVAQPALPGATTVPDTVVRQPSWRKTTFQADAVEPFEAPTQASTRSSLSSKLFYGKATSMPTTSRLALAENCIAPYDKNGQRARKPASPVEVAKEFPVESERIESGEDRHSLNPMHIEPTGFEAGLDRVYTLPDFISILFDRIGKGLHIAGYEQRADADVKPLQLLLLEANRIIEDTIENADFRNQLSASPKLLEKIDDFTALWDSCVQGIWPYLAGVVREDKITYVMEQKGPLNQKLHTMIVALREARFNATMGGRMVALFQPYSVKHKDEYIALYSASFLMACAVLGAAINLIITLLAVLEERWICAIVAASVAAVLVSLVLLVRRFSHPFLLLAYSATLTLSYHHLMLPNSLAYTELFTPLWIVAVGMTCPTSWGCCLAVVLRIGVLSAFYYVFHGNTDTSTVLLYLTPISSGVIIQLGRWAAADLRQPFLQAVRYEPYYRALAMASLEILNEDMDDTTERIKGLQGEVGSLVTAIGPLIDLTGEDDINSFTLMSHLDIIQKSVEKVQAAITQALRPNISPSESLMDGKERLGVSPLPRLTSRRLRDGINPTENPLLRLNHQKVVRHYPKKDSAHNYNEAHLKASELLTTAMLHQYELTNNGDIVLQTDIGLVRSSTSVLHANQPILVVDRDMMIRFWNSSFETSTGVSAAVAVGQNLLSFITAPSEQAVLTEALRSAWLGTTSRPCLFTFVLQKSSAQATFKLSLLPCYGFDKAGKVVGALMCGKDMGMEECTMEYSRWLFNEIRSSLTSVHQAVVGMQEERVESALARALDPIRAQAASAVDTLKGFMEVYQQETKMETRWRPIALDRLLREILDERRREIGEKKIELELIWDDCVRSNIYGDECRLRAAVSYLIHNAIRFTAQGHVHVIVTQRQQMGGTASMLISVADSGKGIPASEIPSLFAPKRRKNGEMQLGLSKLNLCVRQMGGVVRCQSTPAGTTFEICLPLLYVPDAMISDTNRAPPDQEGLQYTTVLLEPNPVECTATLHYLWKRHHLVTSVTSALAAKQLTFQGVEIIIVDTSTPAGMELLFAAQKLRDTHIVITSATLESSDLLNKDRLYVLHKPFSSEDFHKTLTTVEDGVRQDRQERERVESIRRMFGEGQTCPWRRGRKLGQGTFATVYLSKNLMTQGKMAVKVMEIENKKPDELEAMLQEIKIMFELKHNNIVHYFHCERNDTELLIFMEYAAGGCLTTQIKSKGGLTPNTTAALLLDIISGLQYLHEKFVVHRDLKPANILLTGFGRCKLSDFGCATSAEFRMCQTFKGTPAYMAPEIINEEQYSFPADIWSLGVLTYVMLTARLPWAKARDGGANWMAVANEIAKFIPGTIVPIPNDNLSHNAILFIRGCLEPDPERRVKCPDLVVHDFIQNANIRDVQLDLPDLMDEISEPEDYFEVLNNNKEEVKKEDDELEVYLRLGNDDDVDGNVPVPIHPKNEAVGAKVPGSSDTRALNASRTTSEDERKRHRRKAPQSATDSDPQGKMHNSPSFGLLDFRVVDPLDDTHSTVRSSSSRGSNGSTASSLFSFVPRAQEVTTEKVKKVRRRQRGNTTAIVPRKASVIKLRTKHPDEVSDWTASPCGDNTIRSQELQHATSSSPPDDIDWTTEVSREGLGSTKATLSPHLTSK